MSRTLPRGWYDGALRRTRGAKKFVRFRRPCASTPGAGWPSRSSPLSKPIAASRAPCRTAAAPAAPRDGALGHPHAWGARDETRGEALVMDSINEDLPLEDLPLNDLPLNDGRKRTPASHSFAMANQRWFSGTLYALRRLTIFCWLLHNWRAVWTQYRLGGRLPSLRLRNGLIVQHWPGDDPITLLEEVFWRRCYRREVTEPRHGVMIDIGANIGLVTLDWATRLPGATIHAYEPYPPTFSSLISNLKANGLLQKVSLRAEAVGRSGGTMVFPAVALSSLVSAYRQDAKDAKSHGSDGARVTTVSLDDVVARCTEGE